MSTTAILEAGADTLAPTPTIAPAPAAAPITKALISAKAPGHASAKKPGSATVPAVATKRRGPGRPPSKPPAPPLEKKGIVDAPKDPRNRLEFVFDSPSVFKTLFTFFRNLKTREIHLKCTPKGMTFYCRDHSRKSRVIATIAGEHVNWYYCEAEFWLLINRENVEELFATIDKTFFKITMMQTHEDTQNLIFVLKDSEIDKDCNSKILLSEYTPDDELYEPERLLTPALLVENFPIEFTLTAKQFKKTVADAHAASENMTVEKYGVEQPLQIAYATQTRVYNEVYRSPEKIHLRSAIGEGEIFRAEMKTAHIKSLASSMVTDDVRILCRESGDMLFRSALDTKALVVSTFTNLA